MVLALPLSIQLNVECLRDSDVVDVSGLIVGVCSFRTGICVSGIADC